MVSRTPGKGEERDLGAVLVAPSCRLMETAMLPAAALQRRLVAASLVQNRTVSAKL